MTLELKVTNINDLSYLQLYTGYRCDLGVDSNICNVDDLRKSKISHLTLMFHLENEGQTLVCMTFRISGCKHPTDMIFVSILTLLRPRMSKNVELIHVSSTFDLETQGHTHSSYDLAYLRQYASY